MNLLRTLHADLRERQIFPAVIVLAVLAILIPVVASLALSSYSTSPVRTLPPALVKLPAGVQPPAQELVSLTAVPTPPSIQRKGNEPNPFRENGGGSGSTSSPKTRASSAVKTAPTQSTPPKTTGSHTTTAQTTPASTPPKTTVHKTTVPAKTTPRATTPKATTPSTTPTKPTPTPPAQATPVTGPATLASTEAYAVDIDTKDATGTHALADVVRLAPLPAAESPEVIYLGVMTGGKKAAFLFTNSVKVSGAGGKGLTCLPDADDCQIVELAPGQGMSLAPTQNTALIATFTFELTSIEAQGFSSASAATQARDAVSTAGQALLPLYDSGELAQLHFDSSTGALVVVHSTVPSGAGGSTGGSGSTGSTGATGTSGTTGSTGGDAERMPFTLTPLP